MLARLVIYAKWAVCSVAIVGVLAGPAAAFDPFGGRNFLPSYGQYPANFGGFYDNRIAPAVPYFSLHPPVYYSRPVARTYGYSPYAYPPQIMTPKLVARSPVPKVTRNRFVPAPKDATKNPAEDQVAGRSVRIVNPFVTDTEAVAKR